MPGAPRSLPTRPSLRFLKLEAKRRLAAREFPTLHDAQAAIAAEYGQPNWAALKVLITGGPEPESHALAQLRWVIGRFRDADQPSWPPPDDGELREHFTEPVLGDTTAGGLVATIASLAPVLRGELMVMAATPLSARVRLGDLTFDATVDAEPPHRLTQVRGTPWVGRVSDPRVTTPAPEQRSGDVPPEMSGIAHDAAAELGLPGLILAGGGPGRPGWVLTHGWADLDRGVALRVDHRLPTPGISALVTATAVLRLVADGRIGLDSPADEHLRTVRLADDSITVRELLSHTGGVDGPIAAAMFADDVPDLAAVTGPVIGCDGPRGVARPTNGGYAVLGELIAELTGRPYADAVTRLVLEPLGLTASSYPAHASDLGPDAVTGYGLSPQGLFVPAAGRICTIPAVGGLWATAADIVRLGTGWSSLLPPALARDALTPQTAPGPGGGAVGLGWLIDPAGDVAVHAGISPGAAASLLVRIGDRQVLLTISSRPTALDAINVRAVRSFTTATSDRDETTP